MEKLELVVDIPGVSIVKGIKSRRGEPQGMRKSGFSFITLLGTVMKRVISETPNVDWVL